MNVEEAKNKPDIVLTYEEFIELLKIKTRVESLSDLIKSYGDLMTIKQVIAVLNLEVEKDA